MPKLPSISPKNLITILEKKGCVKWRQKGIHVILGDASGVRKVVVPLHNKDVKKGTLSAILRQSGISIDDLL